MPPPESYKPFRLTSTATIYGLDRDHALERLRRGLQRVNAEEIAFAPEEPAPCTYCPPGHPWPFEAEWGCPDCGAKWTWTQAGGWRRLERVETGGRV